MRIGVISDSHGDIYAVKKALDKMKDVDLIVHLGDHYRDAENVSKETGRDIIYVKGNCDFSSLVECDRIIYAEDKRILLTHGHNYNVKSNYTNLYLKALEESAHAVFFGHTHFAETFEHNNIMFVNPGSLSQPRGGKETFCIVNIKNGLIQPGIFELY